MKNNTVLRKTIMNRYNYISLFCFAFLCAIIYALSYFVPSGVTKFYIFTASCVFSMIVAYYFVPIVRSKILHKRINPKGKAVLITGCDTGFGHLLAKKLDKSGFVVFASCLNPLGDGARKLKESCSSQLHVIGLDVTDDTSVNEAVQEVKQKIGNLEFWAVVNNAGIFEGFDIAWSPLKCFKMCLDVNTLGIVRVTKSFLPLLIASKGRIVTVASYAGVVPVPWLPAYSMSKSAAVFFSDCLRHEMNRFGVKVVSIEPELYRTPIMDLHTVTEKFKGYQRNCSEEIKSFYDEAFIKEFTKVMKRTIAFSSPKVNVVLESLFDALTFEDPDTDYIPCRNIFVYLFLRLFSICPKSVLSFIFRIADVKMFFPCKQETK